MTWVARLLGRHSRHILYALGVALPLCVILVAVQLALPAFVFEHIMVLLVVAVAMVGGRGPAVVAAIVGAIGDNVLVRVPVGSPAITELRDAFDLALFVAVAAAVGWLVDGLRVAKERAQAAAERERLAREARDRLVAAVTHDLAAPLAAIQGTVQFAQKHAERSEVDLLRLLARVEMAAGRATSLVRTLTDMKSLDDESLTLRTICLDLRDVVAPLVRMLDRVSDRHPIVLALHPTPLVVECDAERFGRVIENLIGNAIKYSPTGGAIEVWVTTERGRAVISVRDHGIGITPDVRRHLFEPGYRAPAAASVAPGLGLGLHIAAEIVRRHGGSIDARPADGGGSVFTVRLPLATIHDLHLARPAVEPALNELESGDAHPGTMSSEPADHLPSARTLS